jgi:hypothetical protein
MSLPRNPNEDMQARYDLAVKTLLDAVARVADEMVSDKTGWHGTLAVQTALLESIEANLSDNYHADPTFYEDGVNFALNPAATPKEGVCKTTKPSGGKGARVSRRAV